MTEVRVIDPWHVKETKANSERDCRECWFLHVPNRDLNRMNFTSQTRRVASIFDETWESEAALDKHTATPHFMYLEQAIGELPEEPFEVNILKRILSDAAAA